jgi:hypothetical protein
VSGRRLAQVDVSRRMAVVDRRDALHTSAWRLKVSSMLDSWRGTRVLLLGCCLALAWPASAQEKPASAPEVAYGSLGVLLLGAGARLGTYVAPRVGVDADAQYHAFLLMGESVSAAVGAQYLVTETFFLRAGVRARRLVLALTPGWFTLFGDDDEWERWLYQIDLGPDLAFGHRWRMGPLYFAVEWVGAYFPVVALDVDRRTVDPDNGEILERSDRGGKLVPYTRLLFVQVGFSI